MNVVLDTNCLFDAVMPASDAYGAMRGILRAAEGGDFDLWVSRHSLAQLTKKDPTTDLALHLAGGFKVLPHWPIGSWKDQVPTWAQAKGSWNDTRRNQEIQVELKSLAKSGNDIRDRGAYLDALRASAEVFVTSDDHLVGSRPAARLERRFGLRVLKPATLLSALSNPEGT